MGFLAFVLGLSRREVNLGAGDKFSASETPYVREVIP